MSYQPFLIADFREGLENYSEAWLGSEQAVTELNNCYLRRGKFIKRPGQSVFGQLGDITSGETGFANPGGNQYTITLANPVIVRRSLKIYDSGGAQVVRDDGQGNLTGDVDAGGTNTIDYSTGAIDVTFSGAITGTVTADYSTEHARATRGIKKYDRYSGGDILLAFDSYRMSKWVTTNDYFENVDDGSSNYDLWNSTNLIHTATYGDFIWIVDNSILSAGSPATGGVKVYDGSVISDPDLDLDAAGTPTAVKGALMVFMYQERIVLLNTVEGTSNTRHPQRARWSAIGVTPTTSQGWFDPELSGVFGKGGRNDAPTNDEIVSAGFVGQRLVVFFENSTFALDPTNNPDLPFVWRKLSQTRKCNSTFGTIEYDNYVTAVGGKGIVASDAQKVEAFDKKIPDFIFNIDQDNINLCASVRADILDQGLLAYPESPNSSSNNKILGFNYDEGSWFTYTQSAHCFGTWESSGDKTYDDYDGTNFDDLANTNWDARNLQGYFPYVLSGGDSGYVYRINDFTELGDSTNWTEYFSEGGDAPNNFGFAITTKQLNPFKNQKIDLVYLRLLVDRVTDDGEITVDFYPNYGSEIVERKTVSLNNQTSSLDKIWVTVPANINANFIKMRIYLTDAQIADDDIALKPFVLHAIQLWAKPGGRLDEL